MRSDELLNQPASEEIQAPEDVVAFLDSAHSAPVKESALAAPAPPKEASPEKVALERALADVDASPAARYRANLQAENIPLDEAQRIIDCVVVGLSPYQEAIKITDKVYVELKTRTQDDQYRLNRALERERPQYRSSIELEIAHHHLASSLVRYGKREFGHATVDDVQETLNWLLKIPQPTFALLQRKLHDFDRKIATVFSEGYIENFYQTPS